jgi:hypothetical protein
MEILKTTDKIEDKSNNELLLEVKQLEMDHQSLKTKILKDLDILDSIELRFKNIKDLLNKRLKGEIK